jgi:dinuclear metal center YbgI/SA1388 family protein
MAALKTIVAFLDDELRITEFKDSSHNGLQVENTGRIRKVCCGVDASMETFVAAQAKGADLVICHHGLSWGESLAHITDLNYKRIKFLMQHDMALYAAHLPLDAHPRYGNNAGIAKALGLQRLKPFGLYNGTHIGFAGRLPKPMRYETLKRKVAAITGSTLQTMDFGKQRVQTVAVVSGGAAGEIAEAGQKGIDVYISGEPALVAYSLAQEYGVNAIFAGHYATEVFGVQALATLLQKQFSVKAEFIDLAVPF